MALLDADEANHMVRHRAPNKVTLSLANFSSEDTHWLLLFLPARLAKAVGLGPPIPEYGFNFLPFPLNTGLSLQH